MTTINDLQAGKAGEYLVCADLILQGFIAFPSEQGLPFDVVVGVDGRLAKVQVKTTRQPVNVPQRKTRTPAYLFHVMRAGKKGKQRYAKTDVDLFALVALDARTIGYVAVSRAKTTMQFRPEASRGSFRGEDTESKQNKIRRLREQGLSFRAIGEALKVDSSYAHRVVSGKESGRVFGRYLSEHAFQTAIRDAGFDLG